MPISNKKSRIVSVRLPLDVYESLQQRTQKGRHVGVSEYLRERITYDTRRKHTPKAP